MKLPIALVPLAQVAQIVLPYDPNTTPAPVAAETGSMSPGLYLWAGLGCLIIIVLFVFAKKKRNHHRR